MFHTTLQTRLTQVAPSARGSTVALFATFLFMGQASGIWLASQLADAVGIAPVFGASAIGLAVLTLAFRRRLLKAAAPS